MEFALKRVSCDRTCGFVVRGPDSNELIKMFKLHAQSAHQMTLTHSDIRQKMRKVHNDNHVR